MIQKGLGPHQRKIIEYLHPGIDVSGLVSLGINDDHVKAYTQVFSYILRDLGYLVYYWNCITWWNDKLSSPIYLYMKKFIWFMWKLNVQLLI